MHYGRGAGRENTELLCIYLPVLNWKLQYRSGHFIPLDGLRGVAVFSVVLFHCFDFGWVGSITGWGWAGVDLFFVLSGFLITGILMDARESQNRYRNFIARRVLRIFPLYYLVLAVFVLYGRFVEPERTGYLLERQGYFWLYLQNVMFSVEGWQGKPNFLNHFWSLAIEEQFYLIWPWVVFRFGNRTVSRIALGGIALSAVLRNAVPEIPTAYVLTPFRLDGLLMGALAAVQMRDQPAVVSRMAPHLLWISALGIVSAVVVAGSWKFTHAPYLRWGILAINVFFGCLLVSLFDVGRWGSWIRRILEVKWLVAGGRYAYGIYVYHWVLHTLFTPKLHLLLTEMGMPRLIAAATASSVLVAGVLMLSVASYHLFEKRFLELKSRFE